MLKYKMILRTKCDAQVVSHKFSIVRPIHTLTNWLQLLPITGKFIQNEWQDYVISVYTFYFLAVRIPIVYKTRIEEQIYLNVFWKIAIETV